MAAAVTALMGIPRWTPIIDGKAMLQGHVTVQLTGIIKLLDADVACHLCLLSNIMVHHEESEDPNLQRHRAAVNSLIRFAT